jgi:23S rRNA (cytidine1920-2'-O)/16S rRNA (cytidine1409-2'-O)-methyltransferase
MSKQRLDSLMVTKGLVINKSKAHALIMAGEVKVNGKVITKAGNLVAEDVAIELAQKPPYVSRGGLKLAHALDIFKLTIDHLTALDIGASTGGFTDCLLQRGARHIYALDVGYGQLDYKLSQDSRVTVMDKTNAHHPFLLPEKVDLVTVDVSFISVTKVIPNIVEHLKSSSYLIVLLKPQFEADKSEVGKGGIIKDPLTHARVLGKFILWAIDHNFRLHDLTASPITGADGNQEFLLLLSLQPDSCSIEKKDSENRKV